jgi:hypothetical protein
VICGKFQDTGLIDLSAHMAVSATFLKYDFELAHPIGFEPMAYRLEGGCSIQLSYGCSDSILPIFLTEESGAQDPFFG